MKVTGTTMEVEFYLHGTTVHLPPVKVITPTLLKWPSVHYSGDAVTSRLNVVWHGGREKCHVIVAGEDSNSHPNAMCEVFIMSGH